MANEDIVFSVGVEEQLAPALAKMSATIKAFGSAVNAEGKDIERASRRISAAMADLGDAGRPLATGIKRDIALARAELTRFQADASRLNLTQASNGSWRRPSGQQASRAEAEQYLVAARGVRVYTQQLEDLERAQRIAAKSANDMPWHRAGSAGRAIAEQRALAEAMGGTQAILREDAALYPRVGSSFGEISTKVDRAARSFKGFGDILSASPSIRYALYDVSTSLTIVGAGFLAAGAAAVVTAARWQSAFASVARTTDGSDAQLGRIYESLANLSTEVPVAFAELSQIASVGGQMGIAADAVINYTETIAKLAATTNLTADAAGTALGRFASLFSEVGPGSNSLAITADTFDNLGSAILKVGVNSVATESGIVNVATQLSSMASWAGYTADQTIGLAGAMSSLGVPPELSRGVITRIFTTMNEAVSEGGTSLNNFATIAGVSAGQFASSFGTERFAPIFTSFISGLRDIDANGGDAVTQLHNLGITSVRDVPVLQRLAQAVSQVNPEMLLLEQTMADANSGMNEGTEINLQYAKIADTVAARAQVLMNTFEHLFATMGEGTLGPVSNLLALTAKLTNGFAALISTDAGGFMASFGAGGAIVVGALTLLVGGMARATAGVIGFGNVLAGMRDGAELSARAVGKINIAMAGLGVVGAAIGIITFFATLASATDEALKPISDTTGLMNALRQDTESTAKAFKTYEVDAASAGGETDKLAHQADLMGAAMGDSAARARVMSDGVGEVGDAAEASAVKFGEATRNFIADSIAQSQAFKDLFKVSEAPFDPGFGEGAMDKLIEGGFNLNELVQRMATGGRESAAAYLEGMSGVRANEDWLDDMRFWDVSATEDLAQIQGELLDMAENGAISAEEMARLGIATEDAAAKGANALQEIPEELVEIATASAEAASKLAGAFVEFVEPGKLIGLAQEMSTLQQSFNDGSISAEEMADSFETAWRDAYGGASFSMDQYLQVFRRAAEEQEAQVNNLNDLKWRGVPDNILNDLAAMGPESARLVQALVSSTDAELQEYIDLYGQTGFDAMVAMAAQQLAASTIVKNAAASLGDAAFADFAAALGQGTPLADALKQWNLDAEGVELGPYEAEVDVNDENAKQTFLEVNGNLLEWDAATGTATLNAGDGNIPQTFQDAHGRLWEWDKSTGTARLMANKDPAESAVSGARARIIEFGKMSTTATLMARLTGVIDNSYWNAINTYQNQKNVSAGGHLAFRGMANGGYTGDGGKYEPKDIVHGGEFVFTKEATRRIGVDNLYAMMHGAQAGAVASRSGGGYASGGEARSSGTGGHIASFGPMAEQQLARALQQVIALDGHILSDNTMDQFSFDNSIGRG